MISTKKVFRSGQSILFTHYYRNHLNTPFLINLQKTKTYPISIQHNLERPRLCGLEIGLIAEKKHAYYLIARHTQGHVLISYYGR